MSLSRVRTALVTGATGTIGKEIARSLVNRGFHVIAPVRDRVKGQTLMNELNARSSNMSINQSNQGSLLIEDLDLTSKESIRSLAARLSQSIKQLDVLINNAVYSPPKREVTKEGIEMQFAVNVS